MGAAPHHLNRRPAAINDHDVAGPDYDTGLLQFRGIACVAGRATIQQEHAAPNVGGILDGRQFQFHHVAPSVR